MCNLPWRWLANLLPKRGGTFNRSTISFDSPVTGKLPTNSSMRASTSTIEAIDKCWAIVLVDWVRLLEYSNGRECLLEQSSSTSAFIYLMTIPSNLSPLPGNDVAMFAPSSNLCTTHQQTMATCIQIIVNKNVTKTSLGQTMKFN